MSAVGDLAFDVVMDDGSVRNAFTLRGAAAAVGEVFQVEKKCVYMCKRHN